MQVCHFTVDLFGTGSLSPHVGGGQSDDYENHEYSCCHHPRETDAATSRFRLDTLSHPFAELSARSEPFSGSLNTALHLHAGQSIRCAVGTAVHMRVEGTHFLRRK